MRYFLLAMVFTTAGRAETIDEAYRRLFPNGVYVLQVRPMIENSNRIILKPIRVENSWSPDIIQTYLYYEVFMARQSAGRLDINSRWEAREYAVFGSRVFLSEKTGSEFYVKYIISSDLHILSNRNLNFLGLTRLIRLPAEKLVPPFLSCEGIL